MSQPRLEIVTYNVGSVAEADRQRHNARELAVTLKGFSGWLPLTCAKNTARRGDLVVWRNQDAADNAAKTVGSADEFAAFRATISEFGYMDHFVLPYGGLPMMQAGDGLELGRFRLRSGVTEAMLRVAHARMVENQLSQQPGWRGQRLAKLEDGTWVDMAFAATDADARAICASWAGNADCDAFLALIEPISMEFGMLA
ncbi:hypothetical protein [Roseinatronobacter alkalisoli]|uniref:Uncharacterized protein n=1 Tax=Roseinatronobacter alkalisoli TaxID=3028235 RepID=A0ABT5T4D8_9RHOB|nr:hypothetical protein [Roseinatronobacter sp. HJB301]MDD7969982.1 hypothetical protein [Roseinatronobacter sp. HJB301]